MSQPNDTLSWILLVVVFSSLVALCATAVYWFAVVKTPDADRSKITKDVLPLVTVGIIVAATFTLAVIGVLKENSVGALFGAIAGYVLGRSKLGGCDAMS